MSHPIPELRTALDRARPGLEAFAADAGVPPGTMQAYHNGHRKAPPEICRRVVQSLRARAADLDGLADALERTIESEKARGN